MKKRIAAGIILLLVAILFFTLAFIFYPFPPWKIMSILGVGVGSIGLVLFSDYLHSRISRCLI
ncbi:hypothetical protein E3J85_00570 [Patescibacteria group bacterium]|nr:MAG: hypothetical protein E3J85_00570 [Patescibacteria group bacterium]